MYLPLPSMEYVVLIKVNNEQYQGGVYFTLYKDIIVKKYSLASFDNQS